MGQKSLLLAAFALALSLALAMGCRQGPYAVPTPTPPFTKTFPVVNEDLTGARPGEAVGPDTAAAQASFAANCRGCHPEAGSGLGPNLKNIGGKTTVEAFVKVVRDGKGMMPPFQADKVSDAALNGMWAFLTGAPGPVVQAPANGVPEKPQPVKPTPAPAPTEKPQSVTPKPTSEPAKTQAPATPAQPAGASAGQKLFDSQCSGCHPGGGAGLGPSLKGLGGKMTLQSFAQLLRSGKGMMPAYKADRMGDGELEAIWNYLKDLK